MISSEIAFLAQTFSRNVLDQFISKGFEFSKIVDNLTPKQKIQYASLEQLEPNQNYITFQDSDWPEICEQLEPRPSVLYYKGDLSLLRAKHSLGIVGARNISDYAKYCLKNLCTSSMQRNVAIVSGLAYGVDIEAHMLSKETEAQAIMIIAGGIDNATMYPQSHRLLANELLEKGGLLLSEYPAKTQPIRPYFIARNRLIAGFSKVVCIVQAAKKSGSLSTAEFALELGKEVATFPVNINHSWGEGNNILLRKGAHCIIECEDLENLVGVFTLKKPQVSESSSYPLLDFLSEPISSDLLLKKTTFLLPQLLTQLTNLELLGLAHQKDGLWVRT